MAVDVRIPMQALLRFKPVNPKPQKWWKQYVFLCTNDAGLTAIRTCGSQMWACTVPWAGEPPKKTRHGMLDVRQWKVCCMGESVAEYDEDEYHTLTIGSAAFEWQTPDFDKYGYVPRADTVYRMLRSVGMPMSPFCDATETIERIHNAKPDEYGSVELEDGNKSYLYNWDAIMRWLAACMFGSDKQVAFSKHGAMHLRNADGFELVLMCRNPPKEA